MLSREECAETQQPAKFAHIRNKTVETERAPMRAAAALMRHAARVQRRTPVAARRWRPQPTSLRRTALRCLSSKNDNDDDDGGPVAVTIDDDDSDAMG